MIYINPSKIKYRMASMEDFPSIRSLLALSGLPVSDVHFGQQEFMVAEMNDRIIGCAGLERWGSYGLFRSLAVLESFRNLKVGKELLNLILELAKESRLQELFLLTTTAKDYFKKAGWQLVDRNEVPPEITVSTEFASVCPSSSTCMNKLLNHN